MVDDLEGQSKKIKKSCIELAYFMRGAVQYDTFYELTSEERKLIGEFLEKRMEIEGKKMNPVY